MVGCLAGALALTACTSGRGSPVADPTSSSLASRPPVARLANYFMTVGGRVVRSDATSVTLRSRGHDMRVRLLGTGGFYVVVGGFNRLGDFHFDGRRRKPEDLAAGKSICSLGSLRGGVFGAAKSMGGVGVAVACWGPTQRVWTLRAGEAVSPRLPRATTVTGADTGDYGVWASGVATYVDASVMTLVSSPTEAGETMTVDLRGAEHLATFETRVDARRVAVQARPAARSVRVGEPVCVGGYVDGGALHVVRIYTGIRIDGCGYPMPVGPPLG
jgi:hypothetical protein